MGRNEAGPPGGGGTGGRGTEAAADEEAAEDGAGGAPPDPLPLPLPLPGPGPELDPPLPPPVVGPVGGMAAAHSKHLLAYRGWAGTACCAVCASSWASLTLARSLFTSQDFRSEEGPTTHPPEDINTMQCPRLALTLASCAGSLGRSKIPNRTEPAHAKLANLLADATFCC